MSLINDALKRAKQSQQQQQPQTVPVAPALPPVEVKSPGGATRVVPVAVPLLIAVACFITLTWFMPKKSPAPITPAAQNTLPRATVPAMQKPAPALAPVSVAVPTVAATAPKPASASSVAIVAPKPAPPSLKVQGIVYTDAKWQAIVNGQSVIVGDSVDGFRVKLITKNNILFVAPDGTERTVILGE